MAASNVRDNPALHRYEIVDDGEVGAFARYDLHGSVADFVHTETLAGHSGRGLGSALVKGALDDARARGWQVRPYCPFVRSYVGKHPEYQDLVPAAERAQFGLR
ncbi:MAG TPA: GNAT family N-acetyltransferase [Jatrophihabitans sp.]|nr:GNAT family N-acetyltransferase [Jatrophihabitans sp.]